MKIRILAVVGLVGLGVLSPAYADNNQGNNDNQQQSEDRGDNPSPEPTQTSTPTPTPTVTVYVNVPVPGPTVTTIREVPGPTVTITRDVPGPTVTVNVPVPGPTVTITRDVEVPGPTVTHTIEIPVPGPTVTAVQYLPGRTIYLNNPPKIVTVTKTVTHTLQRTLFTNKVETIIALAKAQYNEKANMDAYHRILKKYRTLVGIEKKEQADLLKKKKETEK